jgi:predicted phage terminase large subunit-like protein
MRRLVESPWYQRLCQGRVRLVPDQAAKGRFENTLGGVRVAVSVGGSVTGEGGDLNMVDDSLKIDEAYSQAAREAVIDWYTSAFATRLNDPATGRMLVIGQRVHEYDLPGYLVAQGGWTHVCLPAEYDPTHPHLYPRDPRTEPGELLWPERWTREGLDGLKRDLGSVGTASMLQQLPAPHAGAIFERHWWRYYAPTAQLPRFTSIIQSWDVTFGDTPGSDYVVGQAWGLVGADRYLLHQIRRQLSFTDTIHAIGELTRWITQHYPIHCVHQILIEKAANGAAVIETLQREIPGIIPIIPEGDKVSRAHAVTPQIESGNVYLPGAANHDQTSYDPAATPQWAQDLVEETARFPRGRYDDQVDALTQALQHAHSYAYRTSITSPATLGREHSIPESVAGLMGHGLGVLGGRGQSYAHRLQASDYHPRRSYPSTDDPDALP